MRALRTSLCILLVPGVYNFICFHWMGSVARNRFEISEFTRTVNVVLCSVMVISIWFWGLACLEHLASFIHWGFGRILRREPSLQPFIEELHEALQRFPSFAFLGAILWILWTVAIYPLRFDFFAVSLPISVASHILAAFLYLPLFYRWYKLARNS